MHSGADISAKAGSSVVAPVDGTVSFAGSVPAWKWGESGEVATGDTVLAVSVEMQDGRKVTLMPLDSVKVKSGEEVGEGEQLGTLASSGDRSSSQTHLHLGLKKDGVYYDPLMLFGEVSSKGTADESTAASPVVASSTVQASKGSASVSSSESSEVSQTARGKAKTKSKGESSRPAVDTFEPISSGAAEWDVAGEEETSVLAQIGQGFSLLGSACCNQFVGLRAGLQEIADQTGIPVILLTLAALLAALFALTAVIAAAALIVAPCIKKLGKNAIALLCGRLGGDNIHKLFPAPGTTFMTRGR